MEGNIANPICAIVEAMLPRFSANKILHIGITVDCATYDFGKEIELPRVAMHLVFYRPNNYTRVLFGESRFPWLDKDLTLEMVSCHDSGWRSDGVEDSIRKTNRRLELEFEKLVEKKIRRKLTDAEYHKLHLGQPHFISFEEIKILEGEVIGSSLGKPFAVHREGDRVEISEKVSK